jgi:hypothetical protein
MNKEHAAFACLKKKGIIILANVLAGSEQAVEGSDDDDWASISAPKDSAHTS